MSSIFFGSVLLTGTECFKVKCPSCLLVTLISLASENIQEKKRCNLFKLNCKLEMHRYVMHSIWHPELYCHYLALSRWYLPEYLLWWNMWQISLNVVKSDLMLKILDEIFNLRGHILKATNYKCVSVELNPADHIIVLW